MFEQAESPGAPSFVSGDASPAIMQTDDGRAADRATGKPSTDRFGISSGRVLAAIGVILGGFVIGLMIWWNASITKINRRLQLTIAQKGRIEDALRESEAQYRLLVENQDDLIVKFDPEMRLTFVSPNYCRIFGKSESDLLGCSFMQLIHEDDRAEVEASLCRALSPPFSSAHEERALTLEGWRWFGWAARGVPDDKGVVREIVSVGRDITQRKQAEEALRDSEARLASLLRAAPAGIGLLDGPILRQINERFAEMTGYQADELRGKQLASLFRSSDEYESAWRELHQQLARGEIPTIEACWRRRTGETLNVLLSASIVDGARDAGSLTLAALDVTEWEKERQDKLKLELQLRQAQKLEAVGQLAGGVAHDFNNILTAVLGNLELSINAIKTRYGEIPVLETLHQAERSAERASGLTRQLLAFSRRQITQPRILDLNRLLNDLGKMLLRLITEDIGMSMELAADLRPIKADPGQIEQVVINLAVNARDAMPYGGKLVIETRNVELDEAYSATHPEAQPGSYIQLAVSDTGCGMDEQTLERIFEPFFTTKGPGEGTGLGLATVYGIVKQAGGHIVVYSEPWQGTTFKIYLPVVSQEADLRRESRETPAAPTGSETILLCEDDPLVRRLARQFLFSAGYTVLAAADGAEALELVERHQGPIHLLLTDVVMPDTNGRELSDRLRAFKPDLKTLYVSGYTSTIIAHHGVLGTGVEFLEKPFSRSVLLRRVRDLLDARPAEHASGGRDHGNSPAVRNDGG